MPEKQTTCFLKRLGAPFLEMIDTHRPPGVRTRAIDPRWDGKFKDVSVTAVKAERLHGAGLSEDT